MRDPIAESTAETERAPLAPRLDSLDDAHIGVYLNAKPAAEPVTDVLEERFAARRPNVTLERFHVRARSEAALAEIGSWALSGPDACLAVIGDCGGCTRAIVRATNAIEDAGVPAVGFVAADFTTSFESQAASLGRALRCQPVGIRSETTDREQIRAAIDDEVMASVERGLTDPLTAEEQGQV